MTIWFTGPILDLIGVDGQMGVWWLPEDHFSGLGEDDPKTEGRTSGELIFSHSYIPPNVRGITYYHR